MSDINQLLQLEEGLYDQYTPRIEAENMGNYTERSRRFVSRHLPRALSRTANWLSKYMPDAPRFLRGLERVRIVPERRGLGGYVDTDQPDTFVVNGNDIRENPNFIWHTLYHEPVHIAQILGGVVKKYAGASIDYFTKIYSDAYRRTNPRLKQLGELVGLIVGLRTGKEIIEGSASLAAYGTTGEESGDIYGRIGWRGAVRNIANKLGWRKVINPRDYREARESVEAYAKERGLVPAYA